MCKYVCFFGIRPVLYYKYAVDSSFLWKYHVGDPPISSPELLDQPSKNVDDTIHISRFWEIQAHSSSQVLTSEYWLTTGYNFCRSRSTSLLDKKSKSRLANAICQTHDWKAAHVQKIPDKYQSTFLKFAIHSFKENQPTKIPLLPSRSCSAASTQTFYNWGGLANHLNRRQRNV